MPFNFDSNRFRDSIDKASPKAFKKIAKELLHGEDGLVPCWGNSMGKKVPCKGADSWQKGEISYHDLADYPKAEMIALVLGKSHVAIDADGVTALEKLASFGLELPETLQISSSLNERHCWIYSLPTDLEELEQFKFPTKAGDDANKSEQLEFRTGAQYQVIAGIHPLTKKPYLTNGLQITELPTPWIDFFKNKGTVVNSVYNSTNVKHNTSSGNQVDIQPPPSLYLFVSKTTKQFVRYGIAPGGRNVTAFSAGCDLFATAAKLGELGIDYSDSAEELFFKAFDLIPQGSSPYPLKEHQDTWNSVIGRFRECTKDEETLKSIAGIWEDEYESGCDIEIIENRVCEKSGTNTTTLTKEALILKFKAENPNPTDLECVIGAEKIFSALGHKGFGSSANNPIYKNIYNDLSGTNDKSEDEKKEFRKQIKRIQASKERKIDVKYILEKNRTKDLNVFDYALKQAEGRNIDQSNTLVSFLTVVSSLLPKQFEFFWNNEGRVHPNIFTVIVAPPTYGKDEIFRPLTAPLHKLSIEANNQYLKDKKLHKNTLSDWNDINKKDRPDVLRGWCVSRGKFPDEMTASELREEYFAMVGCPLEVQPRHPYLLNIASLQKIAAASGQHKDYGLLLNASELADFLSNLNRVNQNKNGASGMIKVWNGDNTNEEVKTEDLQQEADFYQCSLLSGIQPKRFREYIKSDDPSGIAARLLYLSIDNPCFIPTMSYEEAKSKKESNFDLKEFYLDFQKKMSSILPDEENGKGTFTISFQKDSEAIKLLDRYRVYCKEKALDLKDTNQAAFEWYQRLSQNIVKFALVIQGIRYYYGLETGMQYIETEAIKQAILIGQYLETQYFKISESLVSNQTTASDEDIHLYNRMIEFCKRVQEKKQKSILKSSDLAGGSLLKRKDFLQKYGDKTTKCLNKAQIHSCWQELNDLGLGTFDKANGTFAVAI